VRSIHQIVAGYNRYDAISNEARVIRNIFRSWGFESHIYCEQTHIHPALKRDAEDISTCKPSPSDLTLLHLSVGSNANDLFASLKCRKAILYHNVTPPHYFDMVNNQTMNHLARGRKQMENLKNAAEINMADSKFNAGELKACGYKDVKILPIIPDTNELSTAPDKKTLKQYKDGRKNIVFVGRFAPNKKIEDLVKAFFYFHKFVEPNSRLIHVGSFQGTEPYYYLTLTQVKELGLSDVHFIGSATPATLSAIFKSAHLFLSMSEHEGFCVPIMESMFHHVPVMAYSAGAVPETMDNSGVIFTEKNYKPIAEMMGKLTENTPLRSSVIKNQDERIKRYLSRNFGEELKHYLAPILEGNS